MQHAPHGVYPAAGDDEWVAVVCRTDADWRALAALLGRTDLAGLTTPQRHQRSDELDGLIAAWSAGRDPDEAAAELRAAGVAAHTVQNGSRLLGDHQLAARHWLVNVDHGRIGQLPVGATPIRFSRSDIEPQRAGPCLGEHTFDILSEVLGYDGDRIAELAVSEVLE
ncbi:MAG: CoA transferase [Acidimicrobiales bacterium]